MRRQRIGLLLLLVVATAGALAPERGAATESGEAFLRPQPVVVASERQVCSMLSQYKSAARITGQDGSHTAAVGGIVYWGFGDTTLADGAMLPNAVGWSADSDASDCIQLVPWQVDSRAEPLLPRAPGELTVWPLGMEAGDDGQVRFFYASVVSDAETDWRVRGVGIASFDPATMRGQRSNGGALLWEEGMPLPSRVYVEDGYAYVFLVISSETWTSDTLLARVPRDAIESPGLYEYWDPASQRWLGGLWDAGRGRWDPALGTLAPLWRQPAMHTGTDVAYNEFLGRYLAVYTSGFMSSLAARSAASITGPWDGPETALVRCADYHPNPQRDFVCYTGAQHRSYARDGGRTIYVTYSNGQSYQVYLHEIRLAAPVTQWTSDAGDAVYVADGGAAPDGFVEDGLSFYASDIPAPGLSPVHRWRDAGTGELRYGVSSPGPDFDDAGVDFYAAADRAAAAATHAAYEPVYRWEREGIARYAALDLSAGGYARRETAFYAACPDADGDGLTDCGESFEGSDPYVADSDGDGLPDGYEVATAGCEPLISVTDDGDGVGWLQELIEGRNPCLPETVISAPPSGAPTPALMPPAGGQVFGDVTCDGGVDAVDGLLIAQFDAGAIASLPCAYAAHVNQDGVIDVVDALLVLQFAAGIVETLPVWGS